LHGTIWLSKISFNFTPPCPFLNNVADAKNKNKHNLAIFCDLRKAFDCVDHKILLIKLQNLGVHGIELEWFAKYLTNHKQYVTLSGKNSSLLSIILGVPQGSILGPLLFLIYINDLPDCNKLKNSLFADDTMLLDSHDDLNLLIQNINTEFHKVINYFNAYKLSLHLEKTKYILFFKAKVTNIPDVVFNFNSLETPLADPSLITKMSCVNDLPEPKIKFLGVLIDHFLSFKEHIQNLNSKLSTGLFFLRSVKNVLIEKALKSLYYSLIHCHIIYAIHVYSSANDGLLNSIFKKQKMALRIITNSRYNSHTEPLFKKLRILQFPQLCTYFKIQFMHSFKQEFLPVSFNPLTRGIKTPPTSRHRAS